MEMFNSMHLFSTSGSMCFLWFGSTEATWRKAGVPWRSLSMPCTMIYSHCRFTHIRIYFEFKPSCRGLPCGTSQLPPCTPCSYNSHFPCPENILIIGQLLYIRSMGGNTAVTLNSVASFSFSSIETFEWDSLTFSCEDEGPAVAILFKSLLCTSGTITQ